MHRAILDGEVVAFDADGPPVVRRAAGPHAPDARGAGAAAGQGGAGHLHGLRPAVARRPLADGAALRGAPRARCARSAGRRRALAGRPTTSSATARSCWPPRASRGWRACRQAAGLAATSPGRRSGALAEGQEHQPPGARDRRLAAGGGQAPASASARCWSACARTTSAAALRRPRRHRLHGGRARPPRRAAGAAWSATTSPFDAVPTAAKIPRERGLRRAAAGLRGRVHRVDARRRAARAVLQGPARRQARGARRREPVAPPSRRKGATAVRAEIDGRELRLTNLDKVLYPRPGFTKRDLIDYYVAHRAGRCSRTSRGRPLTLKRYPQRRRGASSSTRSTRRRTGPTGSRPRRSRSSAARSSTTCLADDTPTLAWLGNLADLELHTPLHRAGADGKLSAPTMVAFDLDPGAPAGAAGVLPGRAVLQGMFEHLGLRARRQDLGLQGHAGLRAAQHARA